MEGEEYRLFIEMLVKLKKRVESLNCQIDRSRICGGVGVTKFIDDLAGAIYDFIKFILTSISYIIGGMLIVGTLMYLITFLFIRLN
ncbi:hypothetical protein AABM38_01885 [Heyndrickxia sp. MSNUG]|uniref:hypothetical protein n=1 Tax=Heyndrickxia sp. MSNUG TaxID=3136677 RepID=UPI003C2C58A5